MIYQLQSAKEKAFIYLENPLKAIMIMIIGMIQKTSNLIWARDLLTFVTPIYGLVVVN
jgi:hypothetical protein